MPVPSRACPRPRACSSPSHPQPFASAFWQAYNPPPHRSSHTPDPPTPSAGLLPPPASAPVPARHVASSSARHSRPAASRPAATWATRWTATPCSSPSWALREALLVDLGCRRRRSHARELAATARRSGLANVVDHRRVAPKVGPRAPGRERMDTPRGGSGRDRVGVLDHGRVIARHVALR